MKILHFGVIVWAYFPLMARYFLNVETILLENKKGGGSVINDVKDHSGWYSVVRNAVLVIPVDN